MTGAPVPPIGRSATGWGIDDDLVHLRVVGTEQCYLLSPPSGEGVTVCAGSWPSYARVEHRHGRWLLRDVEERNQLRIDDTPCSLAVLEPGTTIGLGETHLIAESLRLVGLRRYLARLLGFGAEHATKVDRALRAIRHAVIHRRALAVIAPECSYELVYPVHRRVFGADRPFVTADLTRYRLRPSPDARATPGPAYSLGGAMQALAATQGGTLCYWGRRVPSDVPRAMQALEESRGCSLLALCSTHHALLHAFLSPPIDVAPLERRGSDLPQIVNAYATDAMAELGASADSFTVADQALTIKLATSYGEVARITRRLIALRQTGSITGAARALEISHVSLSQWVQRHGIVLSHGHGARQAPSAAQPVKEVP